MTDLLNCPFCGGAASIRTDTAHSTACLIGCAKIGCFGYEQWEETEDEAIAAWNRRATPTAFAASPEVAALIREAEARGRLAGLDQANGIAERFYKKALARADAANNADDELEATASAYGSLGYAIRAEAAALRGEKEPK